MTGNKALGAVAGSFRSWSSGRQRETQPGLGFWSLQAHPWWHTPATRPNLLNEATPPNPSNSFKQFHSLTNNHSNMWVHGEEHSYSINHWCWGNRCNPWRNRYHWREACAILGWWERFSEGKTPPTSLRLQHLKNQHHLKEKKSLNRKGSPFLEGTCLGMCFPVSTQKLIYLWSKGPTL